MLAIGAVAFPANPSVAFENARYQTAPKLTGAVQCIDPNGGFSRSLVKSMQNNELVRWRMNKVNTSEH
jgi:hypothetical protein